MTTFQPHIQLHGVTPASEYVFCMICGRNRAESKHIRRGMSRGLSVHIDLARCVVLGWQIWIKKGGILKLGLGGLLRICGLLTEIAMSLSKQSFGLSCELCRVLF